MSWKKAAGFLLGLVLAVVMIRFVFTIVFGLLSLLWTILTLAATLLVISLLVYGGYKLLSSSDAQSTVDSSLGTSPEHSSGVGGLKDQYARGELSEQELERELERELNE